VGKLSMTHPCGNEEEAEVREDQDPRRFGCAWCEYECYDERTDNDRSIH